MWINVAESWEFINSSAPGAEIDGLNEEKWVSSQHLCQIKARGGIS